MIMAKYNGIIIRGEQVPLPDSTWKKKKNLGIVRSDLVYSRAALDEYALLHMYEFLGWRELTGDLHGFRLVCTTDTVSGLFVLFPVVGFEEFLAFHHTLSANFSNKLCMQISERSLMVPYKVAKGPILH